MAYLNVPTDAGSVPIAEVYPPGATGAFAGLQGSTLTTTDAAGNKSAPANFNLKQINDILVTMAGGDGVTSANVLEIALGLYNGTTTDQQRGNLDNISLISASAVTTTQTGTDQKNYNARGCHVILNMTSVGTGSVTLEIDAKDPVSGNYYALLTGAAVVTNSTNIYRVYPNLTASANAVANDILPRTWRVKVTANNANATSYTVSTVLVV